MLGKKAFIKGFYTVLFMLYPAKLNIFMVRHH